MMTKRKEQDRVSEKERTTKAGKMEWSGEKAHIQFCTYESIYTRPGRIYATADR